jgi:hypothetical protein
MRSAALPILRQRTAFGEEQAMAVEKAEYKKLFKSIRMQGARRLQERGILWGTPQ